jgi:hypothetical protein
MPAIASPIGFYPVAARPTKWYDARKHSSAKFSLHRENRRRQNSELNFDDGDKLAAISEYLAIYGAIEQSRCIGELDENWDDEGAQAYAKSTWRRAAFFTAAEAEAARDAGLSIGIPMIAPADAGSVDIHWQNPGRTLLINVPADLDESATFYGESDTGETISGLLDTTAARTDLLMWLSGAK